MTPAQLHKMLSEFRSLPGETEVMEFKEAKNDFSFGKLGKYFCALSNEANLKNKPCAWLIFGIENKKRAAVGSNYRAGSRPHLDSMKGEIAGRTTNRITFIEIYELAEAGGRVVLFQIPAAPKGIPVAWDGHYYGRDGEELSPLNLEEIERIRRQTASADWSAEICTRATIADLDLAKIDNFIEIAGKERGFPLQAGAPLENILAHLQLMQDDKICNAALLAFGKKPQQFFTTAITKCARFHGLIVEKPIPAHKVFHGDVFEQIDAAVDFVLSKIDVSVGMRNESNQAPIKYEIPRPVVTEAIVNAIAHRDYTSKASVQVMLFADRLEIYNPGHLTSKLSAAQLKTRHASHPTNPILAELMYQAGYIERFGTGTGEIFRLTKEAGLKEPEFDFTEGFTMIIWRPADVADAQVPDEDPTSTQQAPHKYPASTPQLPDPVNAPPVPRKRRTSTAQVPDKYPTSTRQVPDKYPTSQEIDKVLLVMEGEMKRAYIQEILELKDRESFIETYLQPAINEGFVEMTIPDKPKSSKQSYRLTAKGKKLQKKLKSKL